MGKPASLGRELAVRNRAIDFAGVMGFLPSPDPVLRSQGGGIRVYRDLMIDDRVRGSWTNRIGATLALEWELDRGAARSRRSRAVEEMVSSLDVTRIISDILQCRLYGYQPLEILWERDGGLIVPRDVVAKPPEWFVFGPDGGLRLRTRSSGLQGEELPPGSFLCPTSDASYSNPYGLGLLASCFWPVAFKKGGWRFWVTFAEKYGQAFALGKIRRGAPVEEMRELADRLEQMVQDAVAVIYDDSSVELLEAAGKGATSNLFRDLIAEANSAISTVILGHAAAGQSTAGRLGGDELAADVRQDIRDSDRRLVEGVFDQLIRLICTYNWGDGDPPRFSLWEEEDVDLAQAERDEKLSRALAASGLRLSRTYYEETYNLRPEHLEDALAPPAGGAFAEAPSSPPLPAQVTDLMADRMETDAEPAWGEIMDAVRRMVDEAESLPTLRDRLLSAFGDLPEGRLAEVMAMGFAAAELAGRFAVEVESDGGHR